MVHLHGPQSLKSNMMSYLGNDDYVVNPFTQAALEKVMFILNI